MPSNRDSDTASMPFWRILLTALGTQIVLVGAGAALAGLGGMDGVFNAFRTGWIDTLNNFAPLWLGGCVLGGALVAVALERRLARSVLLTISLLGGAVSGLPVAGELVARARIALAPRATGPSLRIMTFNAFDKSYAPQLAVAEILAVDADVVAVQELRTLRYFLPQLRARYPHQTPCEGDCPVAILAKRAPTTMGLDHLSGAALGPVKELGDGDVEVAHMTFAMEDGAPITVATTHFHWPMPPLPYRRQQEVLARFVAGQPSRRLVLTGDFNLTPWTFGLRRQDASLRPLDRVTRALPTWPADIRRFYIHNPLPFLPIDHIYIGPGLQAQHVARQGRAGSDHLPVLVELRAR